MKRKPRPENPLLYLFEPLEDDRRYRHKIFFGMDAAYLDGLLYLGLIDKDEPWSGLLLCTSKHHHPKLLKQFPDLTPHPVLGKWLYLSQTHPLFETHAFQLITLAANRDPRLGIEPND